jgi:hypothetical protein
MREEIQGPDPGLLKLGTIHGLDPELLTSLNTNSGQLQNKLGGGHPNHLQSSQTPFGSG